MRRNVQNKHSLKSIGLVWTDVLIIIARCICWVLFYRAELLSLYYGTQYSARVLRRDFCGRWWTQSEWARNTCLVSPILDRIAHIHTHIALYPYSLDMLVYAYVHTCMRVWARARVRVRACMVALGRVDGVVSHARVNGAFSSYAIDPPERTALARLTAEAIIMADSTLAYVHAYSGVQRIEDALVRRYCIWNLKYVKRYWFGLRICIDLCFCLTYCKYVLITFKLVDSWNRRTDKPVTVKSCDTIYFENLCLSLFAWRSNYLCTVVIFAVSEDMIGPNILQKPESTIFTEIGCFLVWHFDEKREIIIE